MGEDQRHIYRLLPQEFFPMVQFPPISLCPPRLKAATQQSFGAAASNDDKFRFCSCRHALDQPAPPGVLYLFNVRRVEKNWIAPLQVLLDNRVKRLVEMGAQLLIGSAVPRMREKGIYNVIIVEIHRPETAQNFSRQGGLSGTGHSHDQN
jgi:hypothetical protein